MRSESYREFVRAKGESERFMVPYWVEQEKDKRALHSRSDITSNINICKNVIRMLTGHQRATRKNIILQNDSDDRELQKSVDFYGFALEKTLLEAGIYEKISVAFSDALSFGISATALEKSHDGIKSISIGSSSLIFDESFFQEADFDKCNFVGARNRISRAQTAVNHPDEYEQICNSVPVSFNESSLFFKNAFIEDRFYRWKIGTYVQVITPEQTWEVQKGSPYHRKIIQKLLLAETPFREKELRKKIPWCTHFINGVEVCSTVYPDLPDHLPIVAHHTNIFSPYENYNFAKVGDAIQGVVRELRDLQAMMGRVTGSIDAVLDARKISGFAYTEGSVSESDVNSLDKYGNIPVQGDPNSVQRLSPQDIPPTYTQFLEQIISLVKQTGVNEELFGVSDNETALTTMLRQSAGLVTVNKYFDQLDFATKRIGEIALSFVLQMDPFVIQSMVKNPLPKTTISQNEMRVEIEEGMDSDLQKRRRFKQLVELHQMGILEDKAVILDAAPIQNKSKTIDLITAQAKQQAQQAQQEAMTQAKDAEEQKELEIAKTKADVTKAHAQVIKDISQAKKIQQESRGKQ